MKRKVEIHILGDSYLRHLKNACKKVLDGVDFSHDDRFTFQDFLSIFVLHRVISDALDLYDKEDVKNAEDDMSNL